MEQWMTDIMNQYGYLGVCFLIMLENVFPPIPSEFILASVGFMTTTSDLHITGVVISATIGSIVGASILYWIGKIVNVTRLEKVVDRWGRFLFLKTSDIHKANQWFERYGVWTVFFCRLIPLIRSLISIPAGMTKMNFFTFISLTSAGAAIWNTLLVNLGAALGSSWEELVSHMDTYSHIVYGGIGVLLLFAFAFFVKKRIYTKED